MHKRWSSAGRQSRRQSEAEQTDRLAQAQIGLSWASDGPNPWFSLKRFTLALLVRAVFHRGCSKFGYKD